jgi:hypothetical protein
LVARVRDFLEADIEGAERKCDQCALRQEGMVAEDGYCDGHLPATLSRDGRGGAGRRLCRMVALDELFDLEFRVWMANLIRLWRWHKVLGYPVADQVDYTEMEVLVEIDLDFEKRKAQAIGKG